LPPASVASPTWSWTERTLSSCRLSILEQSRVVSRRSSATRTAPGPWGRPHGSRRAPGSLLGVWRTTSPACIASCLPERAFRQPIDLMKEMLEEISCNRGRHREVQTAFSPAISQADQRLRRGVQGLISSTQPETELNARRIHAWIASALKAPMFSHVEPSADSGKGNWRSSGTGEKETASVAAVATPVTTPYGLLQRG
jgi:hypothetical protein